MRLVKGILIILATLTIMNVEASERKLQSLEIDQDVDIWTISVTDRG